MGEGGRKVSQESGEQVCHLPDYWTYIITTQSTKNEPNVLMKALVITRLANQSNRTVKT